MHTFNREYSQVSSSASESKVSPSLGPLTRPVNPSEPLAFTAKYLSPTPQPLSAIAFLHYSIVCLAQIPLGLFNISFFLIHPYVLRLYNQSADLG